MYLCLYVHKHITISLVSRHTHCVFPGRRRIQNLDNLIQYIFLKLSILFLYKAMVFERKIKQDGKFCNNHLTKNHFFLHDLIFGTLTHTDKCDIHN